MKKWHLIILTLILSTSTFLIWKQANFTEVQQKLATTETKPLPAETFVFIGDTGTASPGQYQVANAIENSCREKNCQAVFILGDIIYNEGVTSVSDSQFETKFEKPYENIDLPFYIMFGNHDYLGCKDCYFAYANISEKWNFPSRYYTKEFRDVSFFIIDTESFDLKQREWLAQELENSSATRKVVLGHRPIVTDEVTKVLENWNGKQELTEIVCSSADTYISGHSHTLEAHNPSENCETLRLISGTASGYGREIHPEPLSDFASSDTGFLTLTTKGKQKAYTFINADQENPKELFSLNIN
jgi:predicted phosphodiesterase